MEDKTNINYELKHLIRKEFNNATLNEYCPYIIDYLDKDNNISGLWCPKERIEFIEGYLRRKGYSLFFTHNNSVFIISKKPKILKNILRFQQGELFNYEYWYCKMKGIEIKDNSENLYDPLPNAYIVPLIDNQINELLQITTKKIAASRNINQKSEQWNKEDDEIEEKYKHFFTDKIKRFNNLIELYNTSNKDGNNLQQDSTMILSSNESYEYYQDGFFIRLSGRSPKDCFCQLTSACKNGNDVLKRIINSVRARECFVEYCNNDDPGKSSSIIFIPWDNNLNSALEFRCFINQKALTCISQYDCYHDFPMFCNINLCVHIKNLIISFYNQIKSYIPFNSCVMDVMLKPKIDMKGDFRFEIDIKQDNPDLNVYLLEFNPFYADGSTGSALFEWKEDYDIIYGITYPNKTVMRIRNKTKQTKRIRKKTEIAHIIDII